MIDPQIPMRLGAEVDDLRAENAALREELARAIEAECAKVPEGWKEAAIAWEVCGSIHREYAQKKDPFYTTRQCDFVRHAATAREMLSAAPKPAQAEKQEPVKDAPAYTFHIDETGKAYLKGFCVSKEGDPLYARPQPDLTAEVERLRAGLENCRLFAARHRKEDWALLILGFCAEAGIVGSVTR